MEVILNLRFPYLRRSQLVPKSLYERRGGMLGILPLTRASM